MGRKLRNVKETRKKRTSQTSEIRPTDASICPSVRRRNRKGRCGRKMNGPPRKGRDPARIAPLANTETAQTYPRHSELQASLKRRLGRVAAISELMPRVLAITLAQGTTPRRKAQTQDDLFDDIEGNKR
jgi:hypothetical protein